MTTHKPFVFIDVETTGGSALSSRVLEVGALRVENNKVVAKIDQLLNPDEPVPSFITKITGITTKDVWDKPAFVHIAQDLEQLMDGALFVAHNVNFDYSFVREEFKRFGIDFKKDRLCTARLSRALYPQYRSHKLDAIIDRHGYHVSSRHRAMDDAKVLERFYQDHVSSHGLELYKHINKLITYAR